MSPVQDEVLGDETREPKRTETEEDKEGEEVMTKKTRKRPNPKRYEKFIQPVEAVHIVSRAPREAEQSTKKKEQS